MSPLLAAAAGAPAGWLAGRVIGGYAPAPLRWLSATTTLAGAAVFALAAAVVAPTDMALASLALGWTLLVLAGVDAACFRLPDAFTLPLLVLGLAVSLRLPGRPWALHLAGAAAGYGALALVAWTYARVRGREGLGLGDAKLLGAAGAWLGPWLLPEVVLIACAAALTWAAALAIRGRGSLSTMRLPFGPPLCLGVWLVWLYAPATG